MRIPFEKMQDVLFSLLLKYGFTETKARFIAKVYSESTLDGINSHGINRVPLFIDYIKNGSVNVDKEANCLGSFGVIERWDGNFGPGIINATKCMDRAIQLAKKSGIACIALRNTNHWMRGGTYGWQAAEAGCIAICFTNTQPNMPPWGGRDSRIGNNPFIVAIPRKEGHIVLDMAISQFAFGKINDYRLQKKELPFPGGWDSNNELSSDPEKILVKQRGLPIGYWKGSALSIVLDMLATILSAGNSTFKIGQKQFETGVSQIFICIYPEVFGDKELQEALVQEIVDYTHDVEPMKPGDTTYYPGERTRETRQRNLKEGIPVNEEVWDKVLDLLDN